MTMAAKAKEFSACRVSPGTSRFRRKKTDLKLLFTWSVFRELLQLVILCQVCLLVTLKGPNNGCFLVTEEPQNFQECETIEDKNRSVSGIPQAAKNKPFLLCQL